MAKYYPVCRRSAWEGDLLRLSGGGGGGGGVGGHQAVFLPCLAPAVQRAVPCMFYFSLSAAMRRPLLL